jgi:hypothetical protein
MPPPGAAAQTIRVGDARGTQSFVHILAACWRRPSLLGLELLWRWSFGIPLLALLWFEGLRLWSAAAAPLEATGIFQFSLQYPMQGALQVSDAIDVLKPLVMHTAAWLLPLSMLAWAVAAGLGRVSVLRHYRPETPRRPATMIVLQLLRIVALCGSFALWFVAIRWAANFTLASASPTSDVGGEPNLVLYCALVIIFSLGVFTMWALLSWVFSIAPLLAVLEGRSIAGSLLRSLRLGPLKGKLVEINLVMGIVKLALIVLAMVFSATPLPFEEVVHGASLYAWWAVVTLLYLIASDFFQVARVVAFVELWGLATKPDSFPAQDSREISLHRN